MRRYCLVVIAFLLVSAFTLLKEKKTTIYLIGDSTMSVKEVKAYPETGWGMPFAYFFDSTIVVDNRAKNGRSTKTFLEEGLWKTVVENLIEGDYVFIQFGHNDEVETKKSYTTKEQFTTNLAKYVSETKAKKAIPILLTPAARRKFDASGQVIGTHTDYAQLVRAVAKQNNVYLIDLDKKSQALLQQSGVDGSAYFYNHLDSSEHPNYPAGVKDNTHFNELGARKMAQLVLQDLTDKKIALADHIVRPIKKQQ